MEQNIQQMWGQHEHHTFCSNTNIQIKCLSRNSILPVKFDCETDDPVSIWLTLVLVDLAFFTFSKFMWNQSMTNASWSTYHGSSLPLDQLEGLVNQFVVVYWFVILIINSLYLPWLSANNKWKLYRFAVAAVPGGMQGDQGFNLKTVIRKKKKPTTNVKWQNL